MKYIVFILFLLSGCTQTAPVQTKTVVEPNARGKLVHTVFFKLKPDADKQALLKSLETFKTVDMIKRVEIGAFEDTGNPKQSYRNIRL